ncbi:MAG TPA: ABC transporter ATP-binding protein [Candidatus Nanopelagicales bacterium]|nr:ABC transporter ATP-binding protein [Candidatus Nanopelagicales bacterium]
MTGAAGPGPPTSATPLVEVRDLVVVRGARPVLTVERLAVAEGETLSVVGPNGAGKSTLLLALASLLRPQSGRLLLRGSPVERRDELAYRRRVGLVLADPLLLGASVFANVACGLRFRGVPDDEVRVRVARWLDRLGIGHLRDRPARQISSGEAQRASLARAFVLEPDLLLLDEPFASVDAATRAQLLDDLDDLLRTTPVACVLVTHDLAEAVRVGDRMAVLLDGRIRQEGAPEAVLAAPIDAEVAAFVGTDTRIPGTVVASGDGLATVEIGDHRIEAVSSLERGGRVLCCLRPEDVTIWVAPAAGVAPAPDAGADRHSAPAGTGPDGEPAPVSSARNHLPGRVARLVPDGPLIRVTVDCGVPLVASITRASATEMRLAEGCAVIATFKATAVHLIPLAT